MLVFYGFLYMFFVVYFIIFEVRKGYLFGIIGLMFIFIVVGVVFLVVCFLWVNKYYFILVVKYGGKLFVEVCLILMMLSCWFIFIGMFIFVWFLYLYLIWVGFCFVGFFVGFGFIFLYNVVNNYFVDFY